ncbi:unnamed protein product [Pleuronectes platessa]|uniref:Uncharacterized protein n=1 Tax=Pleuronectes platessa TaxID=8262 RepID=A0A9N7TQH3_PLEPL|nr:unnamed protein product [Pleuronectes platessa]
MNNFRRRQLEKMCRQWITNFLTDRKQQARLRKSHIQHLDNWQPPHTETGGTAGSLLRPRPHGAYHHHHCQLWNPSGFWDHSPRHRNLPGPDMVDAKSVSKNASAT